jgi:hypothetical protein
MPKNTKRKITEEQKQILLQNPNVFNVGKVSIYYTKDFRKKAVELFYQGYTPKEIFKDAGFDLNIIGKSAPAICLGNWRFHDKKRKQKKENLLKQNQSDELKKILAENKYLKAENEFLKKLEALENQFR